MTDKQMLKWLDQLQGELDAIKKHVGGGGVSQLSQLSDVVMDSPASGELLIYNANVEKWENSAIAPISAELLFQNETNINLGQSALSKPYTDFDFVVVYFATRSGGVNSYQSVIIPTFDLKSSDNFALGINVNTATSFKFSDAYTLVRNYTTGEIMFCARVYGIKLFKEV